MRQDASIVCSVFLTLGQSAEPMPHLLGKIAGIIFTARQKIHRTIKPSPYLIIGHQSRHPSCQNFDIPKMSVMINCTASKGTPTSLAMLCKSRLLSHITRGCMTMTFSSVVASLGRQTVHHPQRSLSLS